PITQTAVEVASRTAAYAPKFRFFRGRTSKCRSSPLCPLLSQPCALHQLAPMHSCSVAMLLDVVVKLLQLQAVAVKFLVILAASQ
ncbi:MAG TPA: hypothetical protein DCF63_15135, partial [Planctomycetaceae bacterium]|nr:hypothetical protein [Planctomycetaceae bacterium]